MLRPAAEGEVAGRATNDGLTEPIFRATKFESVTEPTRRTTSRPSSNRADDELVWTSSALTPGFAERNSPILRYNET